jgi:hypothetical protein
MLKQIAVTELSIGDYVQVSTDWWSPVIEINPEVIVTEMADVPVVTHDQQIWIL